jgi:hypothetical protein
MIHQQTPKSLNFSRKVSPQTATICHYLIVSFKKPEDKKTLSTFRYKHIKRTLDIDTRDIK